MKDDLFTESLQALRESADGSPPEAARTRTRILAQAAIRVRRRRRVALIVMPLAAAFVVSTAWGAVTGRLPRWFEALVGHGAPVQTPTLPLAATSAAAPNPTDTVPPVNASLEPVAPPPSATPAAIPSTRASSRSPLVLPSSARAANKTPSAVSNAEQATYTTAHRAHFVDHDPAAALRAWDAYIAEYPEGRFILEARYNRAISLVRLGRRDDAREALAPFAKGQYAGYRQTEAQALLDALASGDGGD